MNYKILIVITTLFVTAVLSYVVFSRDKEQILVGAKLIPNKTTSSPIPTPSPPNSPKTFKFDSSTDLKVELEKVNPQVLDADFE